MWICIGLNKEAKNEESWLTRALTSTQRGKKGLVWGRLGWTVESEVKVEEEEEELCRNAARGTSPASRSREQA